MDSKELFDFLISEAEHPFSGWDFSYMEDRIVNGPLNWSYMSKVLPLIRKVDSLLDLGTGGGEFLATLSPLPIHTCTTERYESNIPIAKRRLEPLGVSVYPFKNDENLPFKNEQFELVINRHESYSPKEVYRILKTGGLFITQQVGDKNDSNLRLILTGSEKLEDDIEWNLDYAIKQLESLDFKIIESYENITLTRIYDVGAIVFYLKAIPWELPAFTVEKYYKKLLEIHNEIINKGYIDLEKNNHRFFIKAKK